MLFTFQIIIIQIILSFLDGKIFNHRSVTCADAQIVAALTWLKTEKEVTLMSFTDDPEKLKPVNFDQDTTYERAIEIYKKHIVSLLVTFFSF